MAYRRPEAHRCSSQARHSCGTPQGRQLETEHAALAVKAAPIVLGAAAELLRMGLIVVAVAAGICVAGGVALVVFRVRRERLETPRVVHRITPAPTPTPTALP
jgi:hypothetical protein